MRSLLHIRHMPAASLALLAGVIVAVVQIAEWIALPWAPTNFGSILTLSLIHI